MAVNLTGYVLIVMKNWTDSLMIVNSTSLILMALNLM